jgi:formylglycine-generating enzyme required for sulfatase activity
MTARGDSGQPRPIETASLVRVLIAIMMIGAIGSAGWRFIDVRSHPTPSPARIAWLRSHTPAGMVFVPGGWFRMGSDAPDADIGSRGVRLVWTPSFYLDKYPVTNRQYAAWNPRRRYPAGHGNYPVTNVTWKDATAYLKAQGETLPSEAEWEKAARGTDGRIYPWGNDPGHILDKLRPHRTFRAVDDYAVPASPYGARDMAGTVWQWMRDNVQGESQRQIIRGGAAGYSLNNDTTYARGLEGAGVT